MVGVDKLIASKKLIQAGDTLGVAVSGGADSMCLLHYLNSIKAKKKVKLVCITINHGIRPTSKSEMEFVVSYCNKNEIEVVSFSGKVLDDLKKGQSLEMAARDFRYGIFEKLLKDGVVNKIALGHHLQDQTETILLNILRGTGLAGAAGMDPVRKGKYLRPLLTTPKAEVMAYIAANDIPYMEDESNENTEFSRNYIRNVVMPLIRTRWKNADQAFNHFAAICKLDDDYINSTITEDGILLEDANTVRIPITYFVNHLSVLKRLILRCAKKIGANVDVEDKHLDAIINLALKGENGTSINLPKRLVALKEYNYLTLTNRSYKAEVQSWSFKLGKTDIDTYGVIEIKRSKLEEMKNFNHLVDAKKIPKKAVWRTRLEGDTFTKFGGGTKNLGDYLTDIKVPKRLRSIVPVLAVGSDILIVAGVEISDKVKVDKDSKTVYGINAVRFR